MNMFDVIRQRNMEEINALRASRLNDPTYNRVNEETKPRQAPTELKESITVPIEPIISEVAEEKAKPRQERKRAKKASV